MAKSLNFSISEALSFGWEKFKENPFFWIVVVLISSVISNGNSFVNLALGDDAIEKAFNQNPFLGLNLMLLYILFIVINIIISMGLIKLYLNVLDKKPLEFSVLFSQVDGMKFLKFVWATLRVGLLALLGFVLLIVPGIYWSIKYGWVPYLVIDKPDIKVGEAFKLSAEMTEGIKWQLLLAGLLQLGLVIVGVIALFVGILVVIPVIALMDVYIYRTLLKQVKG